MGARTLVSREQITSGTQLLRRLPDEGVKVTGAAWAKTDDDGQPYLYIVSPTYDQVGPLEAIGRLIRAQDAVNESMTDPSDRLDPFEVKLLSPREPVARGIAEHYQRFNDEHHTWHGESVLGPVYIEGAYIYPASMFPTSAEHAQPT